jgi:hypothetical protein
MHLWGTTQGLGMQPLNQLPERADRERQLGIEPRFGNALKALLGDEGWQVLTRCGPGYGARLCSTPCAARRMISSRALSVPAGWRRGSYSLENHVGRFRAGVQTLPLFQEFATKITRKSRARNVPMRPELTTASPICAR